MIIYKDKFLNLIKKIKKNNKIDNEDVRFSTNPVWGKNLTWVIVGSLGFGIIYSSFARIDEVVISRGELQAVGAERPIKVPFSAFVADILVVEGEEINTGEELIKLDISKFEVQRDKLIKRLKSLNKNLEIENEKLKRISSLIEEGAISRFDIYSQEIRIQDLEKEIYDVEGSLIEVALEAKKGTLSSPVDGKVFNLIPSNEGYYASQGEILLSIVPKGSMEAKVFLTNSDIGFIRKNMKAEVRIDAYPFTQFGSINSYLKNIGEEVLPPDQLNPQPRFPAYVELSKQYLERDNKKYYLRSGQSVTVNFIVRDKPVITLVSDIFSKAWDSLRGIKSERK